MPLRRRLGDHVEDSAELLESAHHLLELSHDALLRSIELIESARQLKSDALKKRAHRAKELSGWKKEPDAS